MEKYEKDVDLKQHELDVLKASKAKDLERLQELTKLVSYSSTLCVMRNHLKSQAQSTHSHLKCIHALINLIVIHQIKK